MKEHAFLSLGDERLIALVAPENAASERVAVKTGMRLKREIVRPGGDVRKLYAVERRGSCRRAPLRPVTGMAFDGPGPG